VQLFQTNSFEISHSFPDTIAPNASFANCPADVLTNDAVVTYTEPTASDGGVDLSVSCDPPSGSTFTENKNTTVFCTATDAAGNEAEEFCVFFVTVGKEHL
jgi:hypothetical protein